MISFVLRVRECQNSAAVVFWTEDVDAWSTSAAQPAHFSVSGKYRREFPVLNWALMLIPR